MPARAIGVKWLAVDPGAKKLDVTLDTVAKTEPRQTLSIPVSVTGLPPATDAYVMVAAVDVGILNLTNYKAPDPEAWFFGQRQLGLELRDLYGRLIDGSLGAAGKLRTGGDGAQMQTNGSPPTEKLVAFFSGTGAARRRRQGDDQLRHPAVQRHRARHDGGLDQGCASATPNRT